MKTTTIQGVMLDIDPDEVSDEQLRAHGRALVNSWKEAQRDSGFEAIGHQWDSDADARDNLTAVVIAGQGSPTGFWTSADDEDVPVTLLDMLTIYSAMLTRGALIHTRQREMKRDLLTMTREQLMIFTPGW